MKHFPKFLVVLFFLAGTWGYSLADGGRDGGGHHDGDHHGDTTEHHDSTGHHSDTTSHLDSTEVHHSGSDDSTEVEDSTEHHGGEVGEDSTHHHGADSTEIGEDSTRHHGADSTEVGEDSTGHHRGGEVGDDSTGHHGGGEVGEDSTAHDRGRDREARLHAALDSLRHGHSHVEHVRGEGEHGEFRGFRMDDSLHAEDQHIDLQAVFPNPASISAGADIHIPFTVGLPADVRVAIADMNGNTNREWNLTNASGDQELTASVSQLTEGVYFVIISSGSERETERFTVTP